MAELTLIAGVVLRNEKGQYLLVQERKASVYGLWNWPAGHVDPGETLQEAAIREAEEETGLKVRLTDQQPFYIGQGDSNTANRVHLFRGEAISGKLKLQANELLDVRWFSADEVRGLDKAGKTRGVWIMVGINKTEGVR